MRTLLQLIICLIIAWGIIALLWPQVAEAVQQRPRFRN
jgi:hypothetical protein